MKEGQIYSDFAYDDAFRTMAVECDELVLPFLNFMFGEHYDRSAKIIRRGNEHFLEQQGGAEEKRVTDSLIEVLAEGVAKKYHIECESTADGSVLVRLFEYDAQIALDDGAYAAGRLHVSFPHTGVLFLRSGSTLPEELFVEIETPGGSCAYPVRVLREADFDLDTIFARELYFLLPFYLFNYEKQLGAIDADKERTAELAEMYREMLDRLEALVAAGRLSAQSKGVIIDLVHKVTYKLAKKYRNVQERVGRLMGGRVLDLEVLKVAKRERAEGRTEGRAEGRLEGKNEGRAEVIRGMLENGLTGERIAELTGIPLEEVRAAMAERA